ncbi:hypothetical protein [Streptomyces sp. NPDC055709]
MAAGPTDAHLVLLHPLTSACSLLLTPYADAIPPRPTSIVIDCGVMSGSSHESEALAAELADMLPEDAGSPIVDHLVLTGPGPAHTSALPALAKAAKITTVHYAGNPTLYTRADIVHHAPFPAAYTDPAEPMADRGGLSLYAAAVNATGNLDSPGPGNALITTAVFGTFRMLLTADASGPALDLLSTSKKKPWEDAGCDLLLAGHPSPAARALGPWKTLLPNGQPANQCRILASTLTAPALPAAYRPGAVLWNQTNPDQTSGPALHLTIR